MKTILIIVLAVIVLGAGYFLYKNYSVGNAGEMMEPSQKSTQAHTSLAPSSTKAMNATDSAMEEAVKITYTDNGFEPKKVTIQKGETVSWTNNSSHDMWVASNVHPVHSEYDDTTLQQHCANPTNTTFDECKGVGSGQSFSFTFTKIGTWEYHNHKNPTDVGTVIVK